MSRLAGIKPLNRSNLCTRPELPYSTALTHAGFMAG
jgi:hypothetical protein